MPACYDQHVKWRRQQQTIVLDLDNEYRLIAQPGAQSCSVSLWDPELRLLACCQMPVSGKASQEAAPTRLLAAGLKMILSGDYGLVPQYGEWAVNAKRSWGKEAIQVLDNA